MAKGKSARPSAITKLSETPTVGKRNWLIYADSGVGKTVLAGTAPNALFLTVEAAGTESAKEQGSEADEWVTGEWDEIQKAYKWLKEGGCENYDWIIVDSLSEMEEACWRDQLQKEFEANSSRSLYQPQLKDYQVVGNKMKRLVDMFNRLPINVLYTAHAMRIDIEDIYTEEDTTKLLPMVGSANNGVLAQKVCGMMTLVGLLTVRAPKRNAEGEDDKSADPYRRLFVEGNKRFVAKTRHNLPAFIDRPDIAEMISTVDKAGDKPRKADPSDEDQD